MKGEKIKHNQEEYYGEIEDYTNRYKNKTTAKQKVKMVGGKKQNTHTVTHLLIGVAVLVFVLLGLLVYQEITTEPEYYELNQPTSQQDMDESTSELNNG